MTRRLIWRKETIRLSLLNTHVVSLWESGDPLTWLPCPYLLGFHNSVGTHRILDPESKAIPSHALEKTLFGFQAVNVLTLSKISESPFQ